MIYQITLFNIIGAAYTCWFIYVLIFERKANAGKFPKWAEPLTVMILTLIPDLVAQVIGRDNLILKHIIVISIIMLPCAYHTTKDFLELINNKFRPSKQIR